MAQLFGGGEGNAVEAHAGTDNYCALPRLPTVDGRGRRFISLFRPVDVNGIDLSRVVGLARPYFVGNTVRHHALRGTSSARPCETVSEPHSMEGQDGETSSETVFQATVPKL
jgi:hypothetical protein